MSLAHFSLRTWALAAVLGACPAQPLVGWMDAVAPSLPAQPQTPASQSAVEELARHSAVIFRGTVLSVEPAAKAPDALPTVRIRFRVEEAFRGVQTGQVYTLTEWQGLWTTDDRYRVGEHLVLFLYGPSAESGLASPVSGASGRISLAASTPPSAADTADSPGLDDSPVSVAASDQPLPGARPRPGAPPFGSANGGNRERDRQVATE